MIVTTNSNSLPRDVVLTIKGVGTHPKNSHFKTTLNSF